MIRTFLLPLLLAGTACDAQAPAGNGRSPPPIVQVSTADGLPPILAWRSAPAPRISAPSTTRPVSAAIAAAPKSDTRRPRGRARAAS